MRRRFSWGLQMAEAGGFRGLIRHPGFVRLWIADGLSDFGIFTFVLAAQF